MKRLYALVLAAGLVCASLYSSAQNRYVDEIFSDADIEVISDVTYAMNIDFLRSSRLSTASPTRIGTELTVLKTALAMGQTPPAPYFDPTDTTTVIKLQNIKMDVYGSKSDTSTSRPVIIFLHTGSFLPPGVNGTPLGAKNDSVAITLCRSWAKRGYVAISADYRLGWNPLATGPTGEYVRRGTLMNAVYRAIQDVKQCVMNLRVGAASGNPYGIDPSKIAIVGEGTGTYVANAYTTMDKYPEMALPKFTNPLTSKSFIDTAMVGRFDGSGIPQSLTLYPPPRASMDVSATVALGGGLSDTSWLEQGDAPMMSIQCIRDPFSPFHEGIVIVTATGEDVVEVQGGNLYIQKANQLGNNDAIKNMGDDVYTRAARSKYGKTFDYIFPSPRDKITVNTQVEGLLPLDLAAGATVFENQGTPWQWWDPNSPLAKIEVRPGVTTHMANLASNPDMSVTKGHAYVDTINGYIMPRMAVIMGYYTPGELSTRDVQSVQASVFPNPTDGALFVRLEEQGLIESISVKDLTGKTVLSLNDVRRSYEEIDVARFEQGYYIIEIKTDRGYAIKKVALTK